MERGNESLQSVLCVRKVERLGQLRSRAWRPVAIICGHGPTRALIIAAPQQHTGPRKIGKVTVVDNMQDRERRVHRAHGNCMSRRLQRTDNQRGVCSDLALQRNETLESKVSLLSGQLESMSIGIQLSKCEPQDAATLLSELEVGRFVPRRS